MKKFYIVLCIIFSIGIVSLLGLAGYTFYLYKNSSLTAFISTEQF